MGSVLAAQFSVGEVLLVMSAAAVLVGVLMLWKYIKKTVSSEWKPRNGGLW